VSETHSPSRTRQVSDIQTFWTYVTSFIYSSHYSGLCTPFNCSQGESSNNCIFFLVGMMWAWRWGTIDDLVPLQASRKLWPTAPGIVAIVVELWQQCHYSSSSRHQSYGPHTIGPTEPNNIVSSEDLLLLDTMIHRPNLPYSQTIYTNAIKKTSTTNN
jgi:hypothetical protein